MICIKSNEQAIMKACLNQLIILRDHTCTGCHRYILTWSRCPSNGKKMSHCCEMSSVTAAVTCTVHIVISVQSHCPQHSYTQQSEFLLSAGLYYFICPFLFLTISSKSGSQIQLCRRIKILCTNPAEWRSCAFIILGHSSTNGIHKPE